MGGGGGSSSSPYTWTEIRYAPYIEVRHTDFLYLTALHRSTAITNSPYTDYTDIEVDNAFFGAGYTISSFPSLYDMYGKFMAGLDIEALWTQEYNDTIDSPVVSSLIAAEGDLIDDEIEQTSLPRLQTGMRDLNAVMSSSFVVGKSLIEDTRTKMVAKFSADLKYKLIPIAQERWSTHLNWNKLAIGTYAEIMKLYFSAKTDVDEINYAMAAKNTLWPFTVLDFERAAVGALQGATTSKQDVAGASTASRVLSGALTGAAMGAQVGAAVGTGVNVVKDAAGNVISNSAGAGAGIGAAAGAVMGGLAAYLY
jgi:hypothetical protein